MPELRFICRLVDWYSAAAEMMTVTYRNVCGEKKPRMLLMRDGRKKVIVTLSELVVKFD